MAVEITRKPFTTPIPVGQYLIFTVYDDDEVPDKYVVQVFQSSATNTDGTEKAKLYLDPNPVGRAHFDVSSIAQGLLEFPLTIDDGAIHSHFNGTNKYDVPDQSCLSRFTVRAGQYTDGTETLNEDSDSVFLLNGVEQVSAGLGPSFNDYYATDDDKKGWLTDRLVDSDGRVNVKLADDDEAVVCILLGTNMNVTSTFSRIRMVATRQDNTTQTTSFTVSASATCKNNFIVLNIAPSRLSDYGIITPETVKSYTFQAFSTAGGTADRSVEYNVTIDDRPCNHDATQLAYINTRGGWDYLRFDSRAPLTVSVTGKQYRKTVGEWGGTTFSLGDNIQQYDTYAKTGKERYVLKEQFFSESERQLLRYLLQSPVVQMRVGTGEWEPCIVKSDSLTIEPRGAKFYEVTVEVELARDVRC